MQSWFQKLDIQVFHFINGRLANPVGDGFFTLFNHASPFMPLLIVGVVWLAYQPSRRRWAIALLLVAGVALADAIVFNSMKHLVARPRPAATLEGVRALASGAKGGFSFPSSHTANAFLIAGMLSVFYPRQKRWFGLAAFMVGFSRIYVGVHYPGDVAGSALLGWGLGWGLGRVARRWIPVEMFQRAEARKRGGTASGWRRVGVALLVLMGIQIGRLLWAATTDLDVPVEAARLWCQAQIHPPMGQGYEIGAEIAKFWFKMFGMEPLSLWAIPWTVQTLWLMGLVGLAWWRRGVTGVWAMIFLSIVIPLVSQLSFLSSPAQILEDGNWDASLPIRALYFYGLLGLPLWIAAVFECKRHPIASVSAWSGWVLGSAFPSLPTWIVAGMGSGLFLNLSDRLVDWMPAMRSTSQGGKRRAALALVVLYGAVMLVAVYDPRILRKLNISLSHRNNPQYLQMGWRECAAEIRPRLAMGGDPAWVWVDSPSSRDLLQYFLGKGAKVLSRENLPVSPEIPSNGVFYVREIYFDGFDPRLIFLQREDWVPETWLESRSGQTPEIRSLDLMRDGDPIRQFRIYFINGKWLDRPILPEQK